MVESMLTTYDNPHDPFTDFDSWYAYDTSHGYNSSGLLARINQTSHQLSESDQIVAMTAAIDEIVEENVTGMFRKVTREI